MTTIKTVLSSAVDLLHSFMDEMFRILAVVVLLLGQGNVATKLGGNEDYAYQARASLYQPNVLFRSSTSFEPQSVSFGLNDKTYLSPVGSAFKTHHFDVEPGLDWDVAESMLVTVFDVAGEVTCDTLADRVAEYGESDDVWDEGFMTGIMLTTDSSFHVNAQVADCVREWGGSLIIANGGNASALLDIYTALVNGPSVPPGPYLASVHPSHLKLSEVYRVYTDDAQAFTTPLVKTTGDDFITLSTPVVGLNTLSIPVPSRLYTTYLPNPRPLEGRRIAVKDIFDIAGSKTGGGSRAYFDTYPTKAVSAVAVQRLIDQGGIIVGRVKTSQFANGALATADWVDQLQPFNPRGDGYQQTASSSAGSGAAMAAYAWLDHTIGTDTGGSIVAPAIAQGVFGMRPTWSAIDLAGVLPLQPVLDTAGFFARDAVAGASFARAWYGDAFRNYTSWPRTLIFPASSWTFSSADGPAAQFQSFRENLIALVQPSNISETSFEERWNQTGYYAKYGSSAVYMNTTYLSLIGWWQYTHFAQPWKDDYRTTHGGRAPFVDPSPAARWAWAVENGGEALYDESLAQKAVYEEFINNEVLVPTDDDTCSEAIYVDVAGRGGGAAYRDVYLEGPSFPWGNAGRAAPSGGLPELIVPIGQAEYHSRITGRAERLPLSVALYAARGCDYLLWDLAAALQERGAISPVAAGALAYPDRV